MKMNKAGEEELIEVFLDETKHPIAYRNKLSDLMNDGMSESDARSHILKNPIIMEMYFEVGHGLFMVELDALECPVSVSSPYTHEELRYESE